MKHLSLFLYQSAMACAALACAATAGRCDESATLIRRFRSEAPEGWARLEKVEEAYECTARVTQSDTFFQLPPGMTGSPKREFMYQLTWRRRPGCLLLEKTEFDGDRPKGREV